MKGIVLAGGKGSRLLPLTQSISKQLLPVFDKPMIYYPISVLMLAGIREIMIITTERDQNAFRDLLGDGSSFGVNFHYMVQDKPRGIAHALILAKEFISNNKVCLILGDNIFYGQQFTSALKRASSRKKKCTLFVKEVKDPERFGILNLDKNGNPISIAEKPKKPKSNLAITGLYFFDNRANKFAESLDPSKRGELEISDLNSIYLEKGDLEIEYLGRGFSWLDSGTSESLNDASQFVKSTQSSCGRYIACLEEIAFNKKWISKPAVMKSIKKYKGSDYAKYLRSIFGLR